MQDMYVSSADAGTTISRSPSSSESVASASSSSHPMTNATSPFITSRSGVKSFFVWTMREPTRSPVRASVAACDTRIESLLELRVERVEPDGAASHRNERHHLGARVEPVARGDPFACEIDDRVADRLGPVPRDEEEVLVELRVGPERRARLLEREERHLAGVDPARTLDDE